MAQAAEYSYVLAFTPQNLKLDGSFHTLKVVLKNPQKLTVQARRGYFPRNMLPIPTSKRGRKSKKPCTHRMNCKSPWSSCTRNSSKPTSMTRN